jgi:hypothetical protein
MMKGSKKLINIRLHNGKVSRTTREKAVKLVEREDATYISNTLYKAAFAGVTVRKGMSDADIMQAVYKTRKKSTKKLEEKDEGKKP